MISKLNLNKFVKVVITTSMFLSSVAYSQELVPATSEDQEMFEQQAEQAVQPVRQTPVTKDARSKFGSVVNAEAKKLKDSTVDGRKQTGSLISAQKRKNTTQSAKSSSSNGSSNSDGKNSAPGLNNSGGGQGSQGKSGNHKKIKN